MKEEQPGWQGSVILNAKGWLGFGLISGGGGRYARCSISPDETRLGALLSRRTFRRINHQEIISVSLAALPLSTPEALKITTADGGEVYLRTSSARELLGLYQRYGVPVAAPPDPDPC